MEAARGCDVEAVGVDDDGGEGAGAECGVGGPEACGAVGGVDEEAAVEKVLRGGGEGPGMGGDAGADECDESGGAGGGVGGGLAGEVGEDGEGVGVVGVGEADAFVDGGAGEAAGGLIGVGVGMWVDGEGVVDGGPSCGDGLGGAAFEARSSSVPGLDGSHLLRQLAQ